MKKTKLITWIILLLLGAFVASKAGLFAPQETASLPIAEAFSEEDSEDISELEAKPSSEQVSEENSDEEADGSDTEKAADVKALVAGEMTWLEEIGIPNDEFELSYKSVENSDNQRRSMYCWNPDFENAAMFGELLPVLQSYKINRLYLTIDNKSFSSYQTCVMVNNLVTNGIEPVLLLGDRDWVNDGLDVYIKALDALDKYNNGIGAKYQIKAVALDVESYTFSEWDRDPLTCFAKYIRVMQQAYREAHDRGLDVIQVIPTSYDEVSRTYFSVFLDSCCDEISLMNYYRATDLSDIWNEVKLCREKNIPVETIFETQSLNSYYSVTEEKTFFYDGIEALQAADNKMAEVYGTQLGISIHFFRPAYRLLTGKCLGVVYPYVRDDSADKNGQPVQPGRMILLGSDGTVLSGYTYRETPRSELCYLFVGIEANVKYKVVLEDSKYVPAEESFAFETKDKDKCCITEALILKRR